MSDTPTTVNEVIAALAQSGDKPAVVEMGYDGPIEHTREQLLDIVHRAAGGLNRRNIQPGDVVALLAENRIEWIAAALAVIRCGAIVLPIDTQTSDANLQHVLNDSEARLVVTNTEQRERILSLTPNKTVPCIRLDDREEWREFTREGAPQPVGEPTNSNSAAFGAPQPVERQPDDYAVLFYTSGTTGPPKGVPLTHANLVFQLKALAQSGLVTSADRILLPLPLHHVYPFVMGMLVPLYMSMPTVLPRALTGPEILRAVREGRVTAIAGVPRLYRALESGIMSQIAGQPRPARWYLKSALFLSTLLRRTTGLLPGKKLLAPLHRRLGPTLRLLASGGSALDAGLARKLEGLGWGIGIGYGLTETSPLLTIYLPDSGKLGSVGRAVPGVELKIDPAATPDTDDDGDKQRPAGGEVLARGPNVFKGYWNAPEKTREAFTNDGWYRTGDLGYFDNEGFLYLQGRASTLIVTESGKNIQPEEIEDYYNQHPYIAECGVLEDTGRVVALIIPDAEAVQHSGRDEATAIKEAVAQQARKLASYQRLSDYAISREALPRTRLGKIQRHRLVERYRLARNQAEGKAEAGTGPIGPEEMSDQDRALIEEPSARQVWQWLAERYADTRLTPDTSPYMDLNIDSIEMINVTMEISRLTGVELDEQAIAGVDNVRDLLQVVVRQAEAGGGGSLDPERILTEPDAFLSDEQTRWLKPHSLFEKMLARLGHLTIKALFHLFFRLQVRGEGNLPHDRPFVLVPNHVSLLDPVALFAAAPFSLLRDTYFAGWTGMVFKSRLMRFYARIGKTVPIDPRHAAASSLALGATVLKRGMSLIWFPEGERAWDGQLKPFKPGIGLLLKHYPVDVIPVYIDGAYEAMPRGSRLPRPRRITVTFGQPVRPETLAGSEDATTVQDRISRALHDRVAALKVGNTKASKRPK